ncbi:MAG TPA: penicillin acylase family protein [Spirochaetia bacterium]|nr:penicillin acylase family protein [Spirochaetia bacterium]
MPEPVRRLLIAAGVLLLVLLVIATTALSILRSSFPRTRGTLAAPGLEGRVDVLRDRWGVPHIRAASMHDLWFAQGFVTAQDRFWQMEFWRRIGAGRLSELFGKTTLGTDIFLRTVGFRQAAERDYAAMDEEARAILRAYADGVNAYVAGRKPEQLGLEFRLLKLRGVPLAVEPWVPVDSLTWLKLMALDLGGNLRKELYSIDLIQAVGVSITQTFFAPYRFGDMPVIVTDDELPPSLIKEHRGLPPRADATGSLTPVRPSPRPGQLAAMAGVSTRLAGNFNLGEAIAFGTGAGVGSNNWVISGARTESGKPILANDPHLGIQMPSIWYEVDLFCSAEGLQIGKRAPGPYHVRGFSFPGDPGIIIGHNDKIAWGMTNVNPDVEDLFIERINPENPRQYQVNGRWVDMKVRQEAIRVFQEDEPVIIFARETRHGPIITDEGAFAGYRGFAINPHAEFPLNLELKALALRWTALQTNRTFQSVILLDQAKSFREFRDALRQWDIPSQNFIYADVEGNIGYQTPGLIPIRRGGDGSLPSPGWVDDNEWTGFIPFDDLPFSYNPPKGYIVTANNPVTASSYRYFLGADFDRGYRARRIVDMIEGAGKKISLRDVEVMQGDTLNILARETIPYLKALALAGPSEEARGILEAWNLRMDPESSGAAVWAYFWQALLEVCFKDRFPRALWTPEALLEDNSRLMNTMSILLKNPRDPLWDRQTTAGTRETRDDVLALALEKGTRAGTKAQGTDMNRWRWGKVHTAVFRNQTFGKSGIAPLERIFNRGPFSVGGGFQQVSSTDWRPSDPFAVSAVSSMRQVVDLADLRNSVAIHTTGQSGHAGSRHYDDMIDPWRSLRYHPTYWDFEALAASRPETLKLVPR